MAHRGLVATGTRTVHLAVLIALFWGASAVAQESKIHGGVTAFVKEIEARGPNNKAVLKSHPSVLSTEFRRVNDKGFVQLYAEYVASAGALSAAIKKEGGQIQLISQDMRVIQCSVPYDRIAALGASPALAYLRLPSYAIHNVSSEGDSETVHRTKKLRDDMKNLLQLDVDGRGIKVGIISDGINGWQNSVNSEDLPKGFTAEDNAKSARADGDLYIEYRGTDHETRMSEGLAMLEIVHDLAPGAPLAFSNAKTSAEMLRAIDILSAMGCKIICDDVVWPDEPAFEDGAIAMRYKLAVASGRLVVSAAGNWANTTASASRSYYEGDYQGMDVTTNGVQVNVHDFGGGTWLMPVQILEGGEVSVVLQWNNLWNNAADDYDLGYSKKAEGTEVTWLGNRRQLGAGYHPYEGWNLPYNAKDVTTGQIWVAIRRVSGAARRLKMTSYMGRMTQFAVRDGSIWGHPAAEDIISCAAVHHKTPASVEPYSSRGPVRIDFPAVVYRNKPDICGADQVSVTGNGGFGSPFGGTSAAAPHVAAVCALVWSADPARSNATVRELVLKNAVDIMEKDWDAASGFGRADAFSAARVASVTASTVSTLPTTVQRGQQDVWLGTFTFSTVGDPAGAGVAITGLKVNQSGSSKSANEIAKIKVYKDTNANGTLDAGDELVGSSPPVGLKDNLVSIAPPQTVTSSKNLTLFLAYDIGANATPGQTLGATLPNRTYVLAQSPGAVIAKNFPFVSGTVKIDVPKLADKNPIVPDTGPCGSQVRISGSGFGKVRGNSTVRFGPNKKEPDYLTITWGEKQIICHVPFDLLEDKNNVVVTVGGSSPQTTFTVTNPKYLCVDVANTTGTENGTEALPFNTIQEAVNAATEGDAIKVAQGTYTGTGENVVSISGKSVRLWGGYVGGKKYPTEAGSFDKTDRITNPTTIDGQNARRCMHLDLAGATEVSGFNITGGNSDQGGAIRVWNSSPKIASNTITGNAVFVGGIFLYNCPKGTIIGGESKEEGNKITGCTAIAAGGIWCTASSPTIQNNEITRNASLNGGAGGICCWGETFDPIIIRDNLIAENWAEWGGGGIYCGDKAKPQIEGNIITANVVNRSGGAGILCSGASAVIQKNNKILDNQATGPDACGGGIQAYQCPTRIKIDENEIIGNSASFTGGIYIDTAEVEITRNRITCSGTRSAGGLSLYNSSGIVGGDPSVDMPDGGRNIITGCLAPYAAGIGCRNCDATLIIRNNEITENIAFTTSGGGIACQNASPTIQRNIIRANSAVLFGGGIHCMDNSGPLIEGNDIVGNTVDVCNGAGIYAENSPALQIQKKNTISDNNASGTESYGGGVYCVNCPDLVIDGNTITGNTAEFGGGIGANGCSSVSIARNMISCAARQGAGGLQLDACSGKVGWLASEGNPSGKNTIQGCVATYGAGIVCGDGPESGRSLVIQDNDITGNTATDFCGGGILCSGASATIDQNRILNNAANGTGGGIFCERGSKATITKNTLTGNTAWAGGGIVSDAAFLEIRGNVITCSATEGGGGILFLNGSKGTTGGINKEDGNTITGCTAPYGGALEVLDSSPAIQGNTLEKNSATASEGGGIFCANSASVIQSNTITANWAELAGGGIYCSPSAAGAAAPQIMGNTVQGNGTSGNGAGICAFQCTPTIRNQNILSGNLATGAASCGGGIALVDCPANPIIDQQNTFTANFAVHGASIYAIGSADVTVDGNTIVNGQATQGGGGIFFDSSGGTISRNDIVACQALFGGGIWCRNASPAIDANTLRRNEADPNEVGTVDQQGCGGGILCEAAACRMTNNVITANSAHRGGAGIRCVGTANPEIINNTIVWNLLPVSAVPLGGGVSAALACNPTIANCIFINVRVVDPNDPSKNVFDDLLACSATYSLVIGVSGTGNIQADPKFSASNFGRGPDNTAGTDDDDYRLAVDSPCIDSGRAGGDVPTADREGLIRPQGNRVDMGAYESPSGAVGGSLSVTLGPPEAVAAGAKWRVDNGLWRNSGDVISGLSPGNHPVGYRGVSGWMPPGAEWGTILNGQTTTLPRTYQASGATGGSVSVTLGPAEAIPSGAMWRVDGGIWHNSGETVSGLSPGSHAVGYRAISGWTTPGSEWVTVFSDQTTSLTRTYQ